MGKTSQKVATKGPKRQERGKNSRKTYMKRVKVKILENNQLPTPPLIDRLIPSTRSSRPNQIILMSMVLVYLLSLPLTFVYFLHITLPRLKIKKPVDEKQDQQARRRPML